MQRNKYAKIQLRPNKATQITITEQSIHENYTLKFTKSCVATDTGHLELFRLEPSDHALPIFSARWDAKDNTVDIDLIGDSAQSRAFRAEEPGYHGHHSQTQNHSPFILKVDIQTPSGSIFSGTIELIVELGIYLADTFPQLVDEAAFRIFAECLYCGYVEIAGSPPALDVCPKCSRHLPSDPDGAVPHP